MVLNVSISPRRQDHPVTLTLARNRNSEQADMRYDTVAVLLACRTSRISDLISYQNDRKGCAMIAGKVESVSEHAAACIGMLTDH